MSSNHPRKALISGATGFIGSHFAYRLVRDEWDVHVIVRADSNLDVLKDILGRITVHKHDGTTDALIEIVGKAKPEIVFHFATLYSIQHQSKEIEPLIRSNVLFGAQLLEAMERNKVYKLVNAGTSAQHYNNENYSPVNLYAATKQAFEAILQFYVEAKGLKAITLKLFDTYGPNDPRIKLFHLLKKVAEEQKPLAMSPGEQLIDIIYVNDAVEAFLIAAERLINGIGEYEEYSLSSGNPIKLRDLVDIYEQVIGKKLPIEWGGRPYRDREVMITWNKGKRLPGWAPHHSLRDGFKKTFVVKTN